MTRQALEDAYIAGFLDGRDSVDKVSGDAAATHCLLGFDGWYANTLDTLNRAASSVPDPDGWITWDGSGNRPAGVDKDFIVQVRFGSGKVSERIDRAGDWGWRWRYDGEPSAFDIVAYRVVKP